MNIMNLLDFSEPAKIFDIKDTVSKVTSTMFDKSTYNIVVEDDGEYYGIVLARDIAKRNVNNPDKIEIKQFVRKINPISPDTPTNDVIESFVVNDYNAVPIQNKNKIQILTKIGLLKGLKAPELKKKKAKDLMKYPYCVSLDDSITTVISVMKEMSVSRVPVLSSKGKIEGLITNIDLLRADIKKHRSKSGEKYGEKTKSRDHPIKSIMNRNILIASPEEQLKRIIERMVQKRNETVLIEENNSIVGVITPKEIFKQFVSNTKEKEIEDRKKGVYVRISGIQEEDIYIKSLIDSEITNEVKKLGKIIDINYLVLHVTTSKATGRRKNYSVKGKLITKFGYYFANNSDWDLTKAIRSVMHKFEREILKKKGKNR